MMHILFLFFQNIQPCAPVRIPKTDAPTTAPTSEGLYCQSPRAWAAAVASALAVLFIADDDVVFTLASMF